MSRVKIDYNRVYYDDVTGKYYFQQGKSRSRFDPRIGSYQIRQFKKLNGPQNRATSIGKSKAYFSRGLRLTGKTGHLESWARNMTLRGGPKNQNYNWTRAKYRTINGVVRRVHSSERWGSDVNRHKPGNASTYANFDLKQWIRHFEVALYQLPLQAEHFRILVGRRAEKVFQNSFKDKKFYSNKGRRWPSLSSETLRKRAKRGTGSRILYEYGDLLRSIKVKEHEGVNTTRVYTDTVPANAKRHKKYSICYAGYHNEGKGYYGRSSRAYVKRKFMGHSSHLSPITDIWLRRMMKQYLFDGVFQVRKTISVL